VDENDARARIDDVRASVASIELLLNRSEHDNPRKSLAQRVATVVEHTQDESFSASLVTAMEALGRTLAEHFRVEKP